MVSSEIMQYHGNILEAPELGTPRHKDKMLVPNGVHYRGVPL